MLPKLLRALGFVVFGGVLLVIFATAAYFAFSLFVRRGATTVPNVVDMTAEDAQALLADHGLLTKRVEGADRYDDHVARGLVLAVSPAVGSLVKRGSRLELVLSLGPERVEVPDLRGKVLSAAQVELNAVGLPVGRTLGIYGSSAEPGTVVAQSPTPGSGVGRDTPVHLFLCLDSLSDTYVMPDLVYQRHDLARRFFERRGFRLGSIKYEPYEGVSPGTVLRQYPLPGHPLRRRDVISLVVSAAEPVVP